MLCNVVFSKRKLSSPERCHLLKVRIRKVRIRRHDCHHGKIRLEQKPCYDRILRLEGTSEGHLIHLPCSSRDP